jgi:hypothetical protein
LTQTFGYPSDHDRNDRKKPCPQLPGTLLRVFIPAGAVINLLNLIEVTSPSGICLIIRLPFLGENNFGGLGSLINTVKQAGGTVEVVRE